MRRILSITVLSVLGAVTTVAVAFGCAVAAPASLPLRIIEREIPEAKYQDWVARLGPDGPDGMNFPDEEGVRWFRLGSTDRERLVALGCRVWPFPSLEAYTFSGVGVDRRVITDSRPSRGCFDEDVLVEEEVRAGWPFRALGGRRVSTSPAAGSGRAGTGLTSNGIVPLGASRHDVPYLPLPTGFAADTALFALSWLVLLAAPRKLRCAIRARRAQCKHCGYPVGPSPVCTECGSRVAHRPPYVRSIAPLEEQA